MNYCATCGRAIEPDGRGGWEHSGFDLTLDEHHRAQPRGSSTAGYCGYCGRPVEYIAPRWQHAGGSIALDENHRADPR